MRKFVTAFFAFTALVFFPTLAALSQEHDSKTHEMFEASRAGVFIVQGTQAAHVSFPHAHISAESMSQLVAIVRSAILAGRYPVTNAGAVSAFLDTILANPLDYLTPDDQHIDEKDVKVGGLGSGWAVSSDGYIVTNAHVVAPEDDDVRTQIIQSALAEYIQKDINDSIGEFKRLWQISLSRDQVQQLVSAEQRFYQRYLKIGTISRRANVVIGASGNDKFSLIPADITNAVGHPIPGKDVAIIKINKPNVPTLPLGDDSQLETGDRLFVLGFPGAATYSAILSKDTLTVPTLTAGIDSARKQMSGGWDVIQTDAPSTHGNSGGPVLNSGGQVIGILTFGAPDPSTKEHANVQGFNYVVPSSIIREFLRQAGVTPQSSPFNAVYQEAIKNFDERHYSKALPLFQEADRLFPQQQFIIDYISKSQAEIAEGHDVETPWNLIIAGALAVIALSVTLLVVLRRKRLASA